MSADPSNPNWEGLRVVRGPDWRWGMQDGGEGFVGTIVCSTLKKPDGRLGDLMEMLAKKIDLSKAVTVTWDCGNTGYYRVGLDGAYDLRLLDNAVTGVQHDAQCGECCRGMNIEGFRWHCITCDTNLCSSCYFNDTHEKNNADTHCGSLEYKRFVTPDCEPESVWKDATDTNIRVKLKGIFNEARVKRGRDWENGDEDTSGSLSGVGQVIPSSTLGPGWVQVKWPSNNTFPYRVGAEGKVELRLEKHALGGRYNPEHLPVFNLDESTYKRSCEIRFAIGDTVKVNVDAETLKHMQHGHGGWVPDLKIVVGEMGTVCEVNEDDICILFHNLGKKAYLNPDACIRLGPFSIGQPVRVKNNKDTKTNASTRKIAGATGRVLRCLNELEVEVKLDGNEKRSTVHVLQASMLEAMPVNERIQKKVNQSKKKLVKLFVEAASEGQISVLRDLLSTRFLSVNEKGNGKGQTALHLASRRGHIETIEWLLENGAQVEQTDYKNRSAIHHAAKGCQPAVLAILLRGNAKLIDAKDKKCWTPLQLATKAGCVKCIRVLIDNGCNLYDQDKEGDTALYNAIIMEAKLPVYRNHEIVDTLIEVNQHFDLTNRMGYNAILLAANFGNRRAIQVLLKDYRDRLGDSLYREERNNRFTVLHTLCYNNDFWGVKVFVNNAAEGDIHALLKRRCKYGLTPFLIAAYKGNYSIIEYLISSKENRRDIRADITAKDDDGDTAVHHVAATLDKMNEIPNERDTPEIFKIYTDLLERYPGVLGNYPGLSLMCYLIKHGCPWRQTSYRKALTVIKNGMFREILIQFCPQSEADDVINGLAYCPLCDTPNAEPGTYQDCQHTVNVCSLCVLRFPRCLECGLPNKAYQRNLDDRHFKYAETSTTKDISSEANSGALNAHQIASFDRDLTAKAIADAPQSPKSNRMWDSNHSLYKFDDGPKEYSFTEQCNRSVN